MRFFICLLLVGCATKKNQTEEIERVVSLAPNLTETLFFLEGGDRLVGVTTYCNFPEDAEEIDKIGDFANPSLELILSKRPDLVLLTLPEQRRIKNELERLDINVFVSHPKDIKDIIAEIDSLARILKLKSPRDSLLKILKFAQDMAYRPKIYVELSSNPIITAGGDCFLDDVVYYAGGENLFSDLKVEFPVVSWEEVLRRDPEIILILHPRKFSNRNGWDRLNAVKKDMVFANLDQDIFLRPAPRIFKAVEKLRTIIKRCAQ